MTITDERPEDELTGDTARTALEGALLTLKPGAPLTLTAPRLFESPTMSAKDARRIGVMWGKHGRIDGKVCRDCSHFIRRWTPAGRSHRKCELFGISRGPATDWNGTFIACGQFRRCP